MSNSEQFLEVKFSLFILPATSHEAPHHPKGGEEGWALVLQGEIHLLDPPRPPAPVLSAWL